MRVGRPGLATGIAVTALLATITGCGGDGASRAPVGSGAIGSPSPPAPSSLAPSPASPSSPARPSSSLAVDLSLLELLPADVDGVRLEPAPEAAAEIAEDSTLGRSVSAVAVALALAPGGIGGSPAPTGVSSAPDDLAVVTLARLLPGTFSDAFFRDWRDSHDAAACAPAGGVAGHAQATFGDRQTFMTTCFEGVRIHHVYLAGPDVLVAVTSLGDERLGERLVAAIPPDG